MMFLKKDYRAEAVRPEGILKPLGLNPDPNECGALKTLVLDKSCAAGESLWGWDRGCVTGCLSLKCGQITRTMPYLPNYQSWAERGIMCWFLVLNHVKNLANCLNLADQTQINPLIARQKIWQINCYTDL